ncbi:hypothetical protein L227DRAFT_605651 [Lentinus tigrinus ALCF2SS1-6]|uniref:Uncharacterized protein n=1 Tax=Lentinus tigrinus ALCF2SS1-6 TaxID=1328759 RepID=A0A5C2SVF2_9APHY|nr:hypothetical protein L227DRAFT_605651 [Lentinus tigrinus ALCF2SS1-6]
MVDNLCVPRHSGLGVPTNRPNVFLSASTRPSAWGAVLAYTAAFKNFVGLIIVRTLLATGLGSSLDRREEQALVIGAFYSMNGFQQCVGSLIAYGVAQLEGQALKNWQIHFTGSDPGVVIAEPRSGQPHACAKREVAVGVPGQFPPSWVCLIPFRLVSGSNAKTTANHVVSNFGEWARVLAQMPELTTFHGIRFFYEVACTDSASLALSLSDRSRARKNDEVASVLAWKCPKLRRLDHCDDTLERRITRGSNPDAYACSAGAQNYTGSRQSYLRIAISSNIKMANCVKDASGADSSTKGEGRILKHTRTGVRDEYVEVDPEAGKMSITATVVTKFIAYARLDVPTYGRMDVQSRLAESADDHFDRTVVWQTLKKTMGIVSSVHPEVRADNVAAMSPTVK